MNVIIEMENDDDRIHNLHIVSNAINELGLQVTIQARNKQCIENN